VINLDQSLKRLVTLILQITRPARNLQFQVASLPPLMFRLFPSLWVQGQSLSVGMCASSKHPDGYFDQPANIRSIPCLSAADSKKSTCQPRQLI
jgi:hypothetical protein